MALIESTKRVWVHSNIYDFHATIQPTINETSLGKIDDYIIILEQYIDNLKRQAEAFYQATGTGDYLGLSKKLFGTGEFDLTFGGCAKRTLSDKRFIKKIAQMEYDIEPILSQASNEMIKLISEKTVKKTISPKELKEIVTDIFYEEIIKKGGAEAKNTGITIVRGQQARARKLGIPEALLPQSALKSGQGEIKKHAQQYIDALLEKANLSLGTQLEIAYKEVFRTRWKEEKIPTLLSNADFEKELSLLGKKVGDALSTEILASIANILGSTGEAGLKAVHEYLEDGINITITGADPEEVVAKQMSKIIHGTESKYESYFLKGTHHDLTKQSQTDMILTANGVSVKAQAKNTMLEAMKTALQTNNYDYDNTMWYIRKMDDDRPLTELLDILTSNNNKHAPALTEKDAGAIAYLLANAAWFHYAGSVSDTHQKDVTKTSATGGIQGVIGMAEKLLAISIKDFIGMEITNGELKVEASNIFFLIGNRVAFPVYLMLEDYKNQLLGVKAELFQMRYIMGHLSGITPSSAEVYRNQILESLKDIPPQRERIGIDSNVGFEMGENILSQLTGHINFNFNVAKQLGKLSYKF